MTEQHEERSDSVVDILRRRLGTRHQSGLEEGREDIVRVLRDELSMEHDQAEGLVSRLIDAGQIRYVTAAEHDAELDPDVQYDEHTDRAYQDDVVPPAVVPPVGMAGMNTGTGMPPMPIVAPPPSTGSPAAVPMMHPALDTDAADGRMGYWDICGDKAGVVPSRSRKGQVEPKGA